MSMTRRRALQAGSAFLVVSLLRPAGAEESLDDTLKIMEGLQEQLQTFRPKEGADVKYSNGKFATRNYKKKGADWMWPNGKFITRQAGKVGADWMWPNGKFMTRSAGKKGADWMWPDGKFITRDGPEMSEDELLDVVSLAIKFLRMASKR